MEKQLQMKDSSRSLMPIKENGKKLGETTDEELALALVYAFAMVGLGTESHPKGMVRQFLFEFIRESYYNTTTVDLRDAFKELAKGSYKEPVKHYNNFSPEYFGYVMKLHREMKFNTPHVNSDALSQRNEQEVSEDEKKALQREFDNVVIMPIFVNWKKTKGISIEYSTPKMIYNSLVKVHKVLIPCKLEVEEQIKEAEEMIKNNTNRRITDNAYARYLSNINYHPNQEVYDVVYKYFIKRCFEIMDENKISIWK